MGKYGDYERFLMGGESATEIVAWNPYGWSSGPRYGYDILRMVDDHLVRAEIWQRDVGGKWLHITEEMAREKNPRLFELLDQKFASKPESQKPHWNVTFRVELGGKRLPDVTVYDIAAWDLHMAAYDAAGVIGAEQRQFEGFTVYPVKVVLREAE